jgi:hypothetical protein
MMQEVSTAADTNECNMLLDSTCTWDQHYACRSFPPGPSPVLHASDIQQDFKTKPTLLCTTLE